MAANSALANFFATIVSGLATSTTAASTGASALGNQLANLFSANHTMVTTVNGYLNSILVVTDSAEVKALSAKILETPGLPAKVAGLVNALPTAVGVSQLTALVEQIRTELST